MQVVCDSGTTVCNYANQVDVHSYHVCLMFVSKQPVHKKGRGSTCNTFISQTIIHVLYLVKVNV